MRAILFLVLVLITLEVFSQDYESALGFRTGANTGIIYKKMINDERGLEAMLSFQRGGNQLVVVRQFYHPIFLEHTSQLFFFYGHGARLGYSLYSLENYVINGEYFKRKSFSVGVGVDACLGFEYHFVKYPMVLTAEYKPYVQINVPVSVENGYADFSLGIFYTF